MKNPMKWLRKILEKALAINNAQVRVDTVNQNYRPSSRENGKQATVSTLIVTLSYPELRYHSIVALGNLAEDAAIAVPALIDQLENADAVIRVAAIEALCKIGSEIETIPALIGALSDESAYVKAHAAFGLGCFREKAVLAVDALIMALSDRDEWVRANAADAIAQIGKLAHHATPALIQALADSHGKVRAKATLALAAVGVDGDVIPSLINTSVDRDSRVRAAVAKAFGCVLGCTCTDCVIVLTLSLNDPDVYVRISAAKSLVKIGVQISASIDVLMQILSSSEAQIRTTAILNLAIVAGYLEEHLHRLLAAEIQQIIAQFETVVDIIASEKMEISPVAIASIQGTIKQLRKLKA